MDRFELTLSNNTVGEDELLVIENLFISVAEHTLIKCDYCPVTISQFSHCVIIFLTCDYL